MYHKENGITTMKKKAKVEHKTLFAKYVEHVTNYCLKFPLDLKLVSERFHIKIDHHHWFFCCYYPFVKDCGTHKCFVEDDAMLYVIKVFYHSRSWNPIGSKVSCTCCGQWWSSHPITHDVFGVVEKIISKHW